MDFSPKCCFFFLACNSVRIGQNLLKEVPGERSILDDFANYLLNVGLNGKLNGSRKDDMRGSIWTKNDQSGRQRVDQSLTLRDGPLENLSGGRAKYQKKIRAREN